MGFQILHLETGNVSLEFGTDDFSALNAEIERIWGCAVLVDQLTYAHVSFGGETFLHMNDWDDPCLISRTSNGNEMLSLLASNLANATG